MNETEHEKPSEPRYLTPEEIGVSIGPIVSYKEKRAAEKKAKDAKVAEITKGRINVPTKKMPLSAAVEQIILDYPNLSIKTLRQIINDGLGTRHTSRYLSTIRWRLKKRKIRSEM